VSGVVLAAVIVLVFFLAGIAVGIVAVIAMSARRTGRPGERTAGERTAGERTAGERTAGERDWPDDEGWDFELDQLHEDEPGEEPGQAPWWHVRDDN
jgi:MFS superfamily sulfate permease-like transporter